MSQRNVAQFQALYGSSGTTFPDNTTGEISEGDMRDFGQDISESAFYLKDHSYTAAFPIVATSGTNTYTATPNPAISAYANFQKFALKFTIASTGAATLNLATIGAKKIFKNPTTQAGNGDIILNAILLVAYDASLDSSAGGFLIIGGSTSDAAAAVQANLDAHIADTTDAHAASAISYSAGGNISSTNVQAAIAELDSEKQASLGYTPENVSNKDTDGTLASNSDIKYPSQKATKTYVDAGLSGKQNSLGFTPENIANKATDFTTVDNTKYPTVQAVQTEILARISGLAWKAPVSCATTANITLSGEQTIDGVATSSSRVLVKNQSTQSQNGIYVSASGSWTRSTDADTGTELEGATVPVQQGTSNQNTSWTQTTDGITLGSSNIVWAQLGSSVPDANSTTKGIAKLYPSTSLGTNTDGAPDQNAVKTYVDGRTPDATSSVKGLAKLYTGTGSNTDGAMDQNSATNAFQAKDGELTAIAGLTSAADKIPYFTGSNTAGLLTRDIDGTLAANSDSNIATQKAVKTYAAPIASPTFTGTATTPALKVSGQAATTGKKNGVLILDDGTIQKVSWVEHDTTNKTITEIGVDDLLTTILHEWKNSSGSSIMKILNGQQIQIGGTSFVIEVDSSITSGNARFKMNDNQAMCLIFESSDGLEYLSFRSTNSDERLNISVPQRFRPLIATISDANIDRTVWRFTSGSTNSATELVNSIALSTDETAALVWVKWQALAGDGTVGNGQLQLGVQRASGGTVSAVGSVDDSDGIQRTAGDFTMALAADNTNKRINLNFTNNTTGAKVFKITAIVEYVIVTEPS